MTKDKVAETVIADGFWKAADVCKGKYAKALHVPRDLVGAIEVTTATSCSGAQPLLQVTGVTKRFGAVEALTDVDFEVGAGEVVALVGDNGAGKSTLIKAISGIQPGDAYEASWEGRPVSLRHAAGRDAPGHRDRLPGPRPVRQPRRRREPVPRQGGGRGRRHRGHAHARRGRDGAARDRAALLAGGAHAQERPHRGRVPLRRPAPDGGDRPIAAGRPEGRHPRRADGRARRRADAAGARPDPAAQGARARRAR